MLPSDAGTNPFDIRNAWEQLRRRAGNVKKQCARFLAIYGAGDAPSNDCVSLVFFLAEHRISIEEYATISGVAEYAKEQLNDPNFDLAAEVAAFGTLVGAVVAMAQADLPKDGNGYLLYTKIAPNGLSNYRVFPGATLTGFRSALSAIVSAIN